MLLWSQTERLTKWEKDCRNQAEWELSLWHYIGILLNMRVSLKINLKNGKMSHVSRACPLSRVVLCRYGGLTFDLKDNPTPVCPCCSQQFADYKCRETERIMKRTFLADRTVLNEAKKKKESQP